MTNSVKLTGFLCFVFLLQACSAEQEEAYESYDLKGNLKGSEIFFTDAQFKQILLTTNCVDVDGDGTGDIDVDLNNDGQIQMKEANSVESLVLKFVYEIPVRFIGLDGIENFSNLKTFKMSGPGGYYYNDEVLNTESLSIDFTGLRKLEEVTINGLPTDYYASLDLSGLTKLNTVDLSYNRPMNYEGDYMNQIMQVNLEGCTNLKVLAFINSFTRIDLCQVPSLEKLNMQYLEGGEPEVFDLHCLTNLKWLDISDNMIDTLILKNSSVLETFIYNYGYGGEWFYPAPQTICIDDIPEERDQISPLVGDYTAVITDCSF